MTFRRAMARLLLLFWATCPPAWGLGDPWAGRALVQVLSEVADRGLRVVYSSALVSPDLTVRREPGSADPLARIREMLAEHGLTVQPAGGEVWVVVRDDLGAVEGSVTDAATGQGLGDVHVHLASSDRDVRTRADGTFFLWDIPPGRHRLVIEPGENRPGANRLVEIRPGRPARVDLSLESAPAPLSEVTVTSSRYTLFADASQPPLTLDSHDLATQPALFEDALRAVRRFPGTAGTVVSSRSYVRGGDSDENLILFDGVPIADPIHFEGLPADFSVIDPAWIEQLDFYSGVLPIEYGGRMSSVTSLQSRRASQSLGGRASLGLVNTSALLEGTLPREDSDWFVAARRGNLDLVAETLDRDYGRPVMADGIAHLRMRTGSKTTVALGVLGGADDVAVSVPDEFESTVVDTEQAQAWVTVDHEWSRARALTRLIVGGVSQERRGVVSDVETVSGQLRDRRRSRTATLSQDWQIPAEKRLTVRSGWLYSRARGDYNYRKTATFSPDVIAALGLTPIGDIALAPETEVQDVGAYAGAEWEVFDDLRLDAGVRWERHDFDTGQRDSAVDPRISLLYQINPRSRLRLAWGRQSQFPTAVELPVDRGVDQYDPAARTSLWVLGWDHEFSADRALRIEFYDKRVEHPWPRLESRIDPLVLIPELEPDHAVIAPDRAHARGIDVYWVATLDAAWQGWLNYSGSRVYDDIAGRSEPRSWDQRHALGVGLTTQRWGWSWTGALTARTGWPTTPVSITSSGAIVLGERNSARLSWYGTLDFRAQRTFDLTHGALRVSAELTNATHRENVCCSTLDFERDAAGTLSAQVKRKTWLPTVPSVTVTWEF